MLVTNVLGTHATCEAAMELFRAQGAGHLVVISSVAGVRGMRGTRTAYGASKAALNVARRGHPVRRATGSQIVVTTILPGFIATDINAGRRGPFTVGLDKGVDGAGRGDRARAGARLRARVAVAPGRRPAAGPAAAALSRLAS